MSTMAELFTRDPLKLDHADITLIIQEYRANRGKFQLGNMSAGKAKKKPTATQEAAMKVTGKLNLDNLL